MIIKDDRWKVNREELKEFRLEINVKINPVGWGTRQQPFSVGDMGDSEFRNAERPQTVEETSRIRGALWKPE